MTAHRDVTSSISRYINSLREYIILERCREVVARFRIYALSRRANFSIRGAARLIVRRTTAAIQPTYLSPVRNRGKNISLHHAATTTTTLVIYRATSARSFIDSSRCGATYNEPRREDGAQLHRRCDSLAARNKGARASSSVSETSFNRAHRFPPGGWYIVSPQSHVRTACTRNRTVIYRVCTSTYVRAPAHIGKLLATRKRRGVSLTRCLCNTYLSVRSCRDLLLDIEKVAFAAGNSACI
jgi:hypothetical protein